MTSRKMILKDKWCYNISPLAQDQAILTGSRCMMVIDLSCISFNFLLIPKVCFFFFNRITEPELKLDWGSLSQWATLNEIFLFALGSQSLPVMEWSGTLKEISKHVLQYKFFQECRRKKFLLTAGVQIWLMEKTVDMTEGVYQRWTRT